MKTISSSQLYFTKKIFPIIWYGFLTFFLAISIIGGAVKENPIFLIIPVSMMIFGYFIMNKLVWDLVDTVEDHGEFLLIKNKAIEDKIFLKDIINVNVATLQNPPRISLRLRSESKFGKEVAFSPKTKIRINPFRKNEIAEDLILRVDELRNK